MIVNRHSKRRVTGTDSYGYIQASCGTFQGKRLMLKGHQVVFLVQHGYLPESIDHINRDKLDNRAENLRDASAREQARNHGQLGVTYRRPYFRARIRDATGRQLEYTSKDLFEAICWRKSKECSLWHAA